MCLYLPRAEVWTIVEAIMVRNRQIRYSQIPNKGGALKRTIHLTIEEQVLKEAKKQCIDDSVSLSSIVQELLTIWTSGSPLFREMIEKAKK